MLKTASLSDPGIRRAMNQDMVYSSELPVGNLPDLFMVADGMGGHKAGDYASRCAVDTIVRSVMEDAQTDQEEIIRKAISVANEEILEKSTEDPNYEGMGTTLVVCTIAENLMKVANVGDSRLYLLREHKITQITEDHSLVQEMVRLGKIDLENARNHPKKNIITKAVGVMPEVEADYFDVPLQKGDEILLCSDGLSNMLEDEEIRMIMETARDITEQAEALVRAANNNGGKDNISVIVIEPFAE